ncbi:MAG TPA: neocarzinostatin apoprotein domain-containing protein, partial [Acidimicrobiales bacterium]|nr:neocarzinostatin apoprotein domain-containing protein [Acidimicrobiales bacterium]
MVGPTQDAVLELGAQPPDRRRRLGPLAVAVGSLLAVVAVAVLVGPDGDGEVAVEEATTTTGVPGHAPGRDAFPAPLALGAPDDGKESVGLPVRADPSTGLVHGQQVTVTGTGFPPGESVGVVMCAKEAGRDHGARGAEACNLGRFAQATSDADGTATVTFAVSRLVVLDGVEIDCASEPGRCLIGMGMISDYDTSGGVLVDFDPSVPLPDPPTATLERTTDLVSGEPVGLRVTGLVPGSSVT